MDNEEFQNIMIQQFNKVFEKLDVVESRLTSLEKGQSKLENRIEKVENTIDQLQLYVENKAADKLRILFDGWQEHEDKTADLAEKLDTLNANFDRLETKLGRMEIKLDRVAGVQLHHSEMLDILAAKSVHQEAEISALKKVK